MLDGFDATYGVDAPRSVMLSTAARDQLATSTAFTRHGPDTRTVKPAGWYRGVPVDLVSHDHAWLVAIIATQTTGGSAPALYGDTRSGNITATPPSLR